MKLCCGETWGVAQARWKPAEESAESSGRDEARSSAGKKNKNKIKIDDPGAGRLTGRNENPNMGLVVWTEMLSL